MPCWLGERENAGVGGILVYGLAIIWEYGTASPVYIASVNVWNNRACATNVPGIGQMYCFQTGSFTRRVRTK